MLKTGAMILSIWCVLNILPGLMSLGFIATGIHAPGLRMLYAVDEIPTIAPRALATIDGIATLANALIVAYFAMFLVVIRMGLVKGERWAFYFLAGSVLFLQPAAYASDHFFEGKNLIVLNVSSVILLVAFGLCGKALFGTKAA